MINSLRFAQRATESNPSSAFFRIADGRVTGFNGTLAMSAPLQLAFQAAPAAVPFVKAINACEGVVSIAQESVHKIIVTSGKFKASVPCVAVKDVASVEPEGVIYRNVDNLQKAFKVLRPFLADETTAGREWSSNIKVDGEFAYVTDNTVLIEYWLGSTHSAYGFNAFPTLSIPFEAIEEVIKVNHRLEAIQANHNSITFHFSDGTWIRSQLNVLPWPNVRAMIDHNWNNDTLSPITPDLKDACLKLGKFGGRDHLEIYFRGTDIATSRKETMDIATIQTVAPETGCYTVKHLNKVLNIATAIDFSSYPKPACFVGENLRGIFVGVREEGV